MIAVSNASPVIFLSKLGALDLLAHRSDLLSLPWSSTELFLATTDFCVQFLAENVVKLWGWF